MWVRAVVHVLPLLVRRIHQVELEVPEYVHSNLVTDIPVIRNGLNDVVIASIDPETGVIKLRTKNTVNDINDELPLKDGDKIDILYVNEHDGQSVLQMVTRPFLLDQLNKLRLVTISDLDARIGRSQNK